MTNAEIANLFDVHGIRCEKMYPLCMTPETPPHSELANELLGCDFNEIVNSIDGLTEDDRANLKDIDDVNALFWDKQINGFLAQFSKPVQTFYSEHSCSSSWGYSRLVWLYADTIEDLANKAVAWAKEQHELNKRQSLEKSNG